MSAVGGLTDLARVARRGSALRRIEGIEIPTLVEGPVDQID